MSKFDIDILDLIEDQEVRMRLVAGAAIPPQLTRSTVDDRYPPRKGPGKANPLPEDLTG